MNRIAVIGANGQVGAEVCLRLRKVPGIEVVPVARNASGSAFLRLNGMECRHGRITDPNESSALIGDCDTVITFALSATQIPKADREINRKIIHGIVAGAKTGAVVLFASTIMVYAPALRIPLPDAYGFEKLGTERLLRKLCRSAGLGCFVFRLGHVLGELQNITRKICSEITSDKVALPHQGNIGSNSVFTATIVEAVRKAAAGEVGPGTYDLVSSPQWSWLEVYRYYALQLGVPLKLVEADESKEPGKTAPSGGGLTRFLQRQFVRERLLYLLGFLSKRTNEKVYAHYLQSRVALDIAALRESQKIPYSVQDWRELKIHPVPNLTDPISLMSLYPLECSFGRPESSGSVNTEQVVDQSRP